MTTKIKICGLTTTNALDAALDAGADFVGFVMVKASPRYAAPSLAKRLVNPVSYTHLTLPTILLV